MNGEFSPQEQPFVPNEAQKEEGIDDVFFAKARNHFELTNEDELDLFEIDAEAQLGSLSEKKPGLSAEQIEIEKEARFHIDKWKERGYFEAVALEAKIKADYEEFDFIYQVLQDRLLSVPPESYEFSREYIAYIHAHNLLTRHFREYNGQSVKNNGKEYVNNLAISREALAILKYTSEQLLSSLEHSQNVNFSDSSEDLSFAHTLEWFEKEAKGILDSGIEEAENVRKKIEKLEGLKRAYIQYDVLYKKNEQLRNETERYAKNGAIEWSLQNHIYEVFYLLSSRIREAKEQKNFLEHIDTLQTAIHLLKASNLLLEKLALKVK